MPDELDLGRYRLSDGLHREIFRTQIVPEQLGAPVSQRQPVVQVS
jgi:hypothetical protein